MANNLLPQSFLPGNLDDVPAPELVAAGRATVELRDRCHFELGRLIAYVHANPRRFGYASGIDFAEAEYRIREREAYHLMEVEKATRALPCLRDAYEHGKASFSNVREAVK